MFNNKILICIPTYNRPREIERLLNCLSVQTDIDFTLILLNDGSNPDLDALILNHRFPFRLHYFKSEQPSGLPAARNKILDYIERNKLALVKSYVAFLDDDLILDNIFVEQIRNYAGRYDGFCFRLIQRGASSTFDFTHNKLLQYIFTPIIGKVIAPLGIFFGGFYIPRHTTKPVDHINGGCLIYDFSKNHVARFDMKLNEGNYVMEDTCFSYGLKQSGNDLRYIGEYTYIHAPPETGGCKISDRKKKFFWYWKHKFYFFQKFHGKYSRSMAIIMSCFECVIFSIMARVNLFPELIHATKHTA